MPKPITQYTGTPSVPDSAKIARVLSWLDTLQSLPPVFVGIQAHQHPDGSLSTTVSGLEHFRIDPSFACDKLSKIPKCEFAHVRSHQKLHADGTPDGPRETDVVLGGDVREGVKRKLLVVFGGRRLRRRDVVVFREVIPKRSSSESSDGW